MRTGSRAGADWAFRAGWRTQPARRRQGQSSTDGRTSWPWPPGSTCMGTRIKGTRCTGLLFLALAYWLPLGRIESTHFIDQGLLLVVVLRRDVHGDLLRLLQHRDERLVVANHDGRLARGRGKALDAGRLAIDSRIDGAISLADEAMAVAVKESVLAPLGMATQHQANAVVA